MRLVKTALACATIILVVSASMAEDLARLQNPAPAELGPLQGEKDSGVLQNPAPIDLGPLQPTPQNGNGRPGYAQNGGNANNNNNVEYNPRCDPRCKGPMYYASLESLYLQLRHPLDQALVVDRTTGAELLTTTGLDFHMRVGPRVNFLCMLEEDSTVDVSYFGIYNWERNDAIAGSDNLRLPGNFGLARVDYSSADAMEITYTAKLHSVEGNLYWGSPKKNSLTPLIGVRFMKLDEAFNLVSFDAVTGTSHYDITSRNDLFGVQAGARFQAESRRWGLVAATKFGVYDNSAKVSTLVTDLNDSLVVRDAAPERAFAAFAVDMSITATYRLRSGMYLRGGYNFLWITGVARAPDQLDFTNNAVSASAVQFREGALLHGPHLGFEARW